MLPIEFKERTGFDVDSETYSAIEEVYNAHVDTKDAFCSEWKKMPENMRNAIVEAIMRRRKTANDLEDKIEAMEYDEKVRREVTRDRLLGVLDEDYSSTIVYDMVPIDQILHYKLENSIDFTVRDFDAMKAAIEYYYTKRK